MPNWIILLIAIGALVLVFVMIYNALVAAREQSENAFSQIDVQLKRRADLIPNLVETVKGAMSHERETLESVTRLRNQAVDLQGSPDRAKRLGTEGRLSGALGRLFAVMENYPDIKATQNVAQLTEELTSTENRIGFARQHYNDTATRFNTKIAQIPSNLVAALMGLGEFPLFEIESPAERQVPEVKLTS